MASRRRAGCDGRGRECSAPQAVARRSPSHASHCPRPVRRRAGQCRPRSLRAGLGAADPGVPPPPADLGSLSSRRPPTTRPPCPCRPRRRPCRCPPGRPPHRSARERRPRWTLSPSRSPAARPAGPRPRASTPPRRPSRTASWSARCSGRRRTAADRPVTGDRADSAQPRTSRPSGAREGARRTRRTPRARRRRRGQRGLGGYRGLGGRRRAPPDRGGLTVDGACPDAWGGEGGATLSATMSVPGGERVAGAGCRPADVPGDRRPARWFRRAGHVLRRWDGGARRAPVPAGPSATRCPPWSPVVS